jgi:UDP-glucose 6-dehydrogenase
MKLSDRKNGMRIGVIGTGHVGLITCVTLADSATT